jgi:2-polyprenyl-6-hydroxyphenyl methylase/3-demethylubiquinone-9 3-methyltransferase
MTGASASIDPAELRRFERLGAQWWDPQGPMRPLHRMNPVRVDWIRRGVERHLRPAPAAGLAGLRVLDIGCGAGLLSEALAERGADVTGLDPAQGNIAIARQHAEAGGLAIDYRAGTAEEVSATGAMFDVVCAMEVVEHVVDVAAFVATAASMVRPGGLFFVSTLNRTLKSFTLAVVGAEYVLRWVPKGTHQWERFVTPEELQVAMREAGLRQLERSGLAYTPIVDRWRLTRNLDVNYVVCAQRPPSGASLTNAEKTRFHRD